MTQTFLPSWIIVPAAGAGHRMQADKPKQYLKLGKLTVLENTLHRLSRIPNVKGIVVVLSANDKYWDSISKPDSVNIHTTIGGAERCHSVLTGLEAIKQDVNEKDWVMVHDAARPCFDLKDIAMLHERIDAQGVVGGILGLPMLDTIKRVSKQQTIKETVRRESLWRALTPQMFRYMNLYYALTDAIQKNIAITDDAQVMELVKHQPIIVESSPMNIKVTRPEDLRLAEMYLRELQYDD